MQNEGTNENTKARRDELVEKAKVPLSIYIYIYIYIPCLCIARVVRVECAVVIT